MTGEHRARNARIAVVGAVAVFVLAGVANGFLNSAGSDSYKHVTDSGASDPVVFQVEADRTKLSVSPSEWSVPQGTQLPVFKSGCAGLDDWAVDVARAYALDPVIRVTATGQSTVPVVLHRAYPTVLSHGALPGYVGVNCPIGGPLPIETAEIDLDAPDRTTYQGPSQQRLPDLAYSLANNEAGIFMVQRFSNHSDSGLYVWDLMVEYSVAGKSYNVDLNKKLSIPAFQTAGFCGETALFQWGNGWTNQGPATC